MGFFDDMTTALAEYPVNDVVLEIVDVDAPGDVLNVSEEATFKVKVTNNGPLNLTGVTLRIKGQHGALLRNPNGVLDPNPLTAEAAAITPVLFVAEFVSDPLPTIFGDGGTRTTGTFTLKAPAAPQASQTLVKATLEAWDANLDRILVGHSNPLPNAPKGTYSTAVIQS
jgi:hypothetical protein